MKKILALAIALSIFFGCINFDGGQPGSPSVPGTSGGTKSPSVVIISKTNYSTLGNGTSGAGNATMGGLKFVNNPDAFVTVYFIPVAGEANQGDSILIKKGDVDILVDAGPDPDGGKTIDFLKSKKVDDIEIFISTHMDPEHYGGIKAVVDEYPVEQFWWMGNSFGSNDYANIVSGVKAAGIPVKVVARDDVISVNGMNLRVLNPPNGDAASGSSDMADNNAIAIKLDDRNFCIMLTSDILFEAETQIGLLQDVQCDIMQVPEHGLGIGNAKLGLFLLKIQPKDAITSGGATDYHSQGGKQESRSSTFEILRLRNITSYVNYEKGAVKVVSNGKTYAISYE